VQHDHRQQRAPGSAATTNDAAAPGRSTLSGALYESEGGDVPKLAAQGVSGPATELPFRDQIQRSFGRHDLSDVRAHIGGPAAKACRGMGANAFATGQDIAFREAPDLHTAAHEAAHVVQQRAGVQVAGGVGQVGDRYERNADAVADAVVAGASAEALLDGTARGAADATRRPVQQQAGKQAAPCPTCAGEACECDGKPRGQAGVLQLQEAGPDRPGDATWEPPDSCPTDFCKPFPSTFLAQLNKDAMWPILRLGIAAKVGIKAAGLWELWAMGGTGLLNLSALFGGDFTSSPTTATTTSFLTREISTAVAARAPVAANASETVPLANLIGPAVAAINTPGDLHEMNFAVIGDLAGNIAGGIGADQAAHPIGRRPSAQNDDRAVTGSVLIEGLASGNRRVTPTMSYTVKDTIDLCPGNCGASSEQVATVPMSRWEASGIAGDVPYSITFAPPAAGAAPFEVGSAAPATPAPEPEGGTTG
jgi:hypothetical protein